MRDRIAFRPAMRLVLLAVAIGFALVPLATVMIQRLTEAQTSPVLWHEGDGPCLEVCTINAARLTQKLGVYSRFGGSHLGPIYFYWLAPFYVMLGRSATAMSFGVVMLHTCSVALLLLIMLNASRRYDCQTIFVGPLLLTAYLRLIPLDSIWNPHVLALPFAVFLSAAALLGTGCSVALPVVVLLGSFCIQTHFATGPCVGVVTMASLVAFARRMLNAGTSPHRSVKLSIALSCLVLLTVWLPPLLEQIEDSTGNLRAFIRYVRSSSAELGWVESAGLLAAEISWAAPVAKAVGLTVDKGLLQNVSFALALLQMGAAVVVVAGQRCKHCRSLASVALVAVLAGFMTIVNVRGGLHRALIDWMSAIGLVGYSVLLTACLPSARRRPGASVDDQRPGEYARGPVYVLLALLSILSISVAATGVKNIFFASGEMTPRGSERVRDLSRKLIHYLTEREVHRPHMVANPDRVKWAVTTGLGLELVKAGRPFSLDINRLGAAFRPSRADDVVVLVGDRPCRSDLCFAIAQDETADAPRGPEDRYTFVSLVSIPGRIEAGRLAGALDDLVDTETRRIPAPLSQSLWALINSPAEGNVVYAVPSTSDEDKLEPLERVAIHRVADGLQITSGSYSPQTVTRAFTLRGTGVYFILLDLTVDHDDVGRVFYGRPSREFRPDDSTGFWLFKGRNVVGIPIPVPSTLERIRLDPGHKRGTYTLTELLIKEFPIDAVLHR